MQVVKEIDGIQYGPIDESHLDEVVRCSGEIFTRNEPMTRCLNISLDEFDHFARHAYPSMLAKKLSFGARDTATGQLVGVRISDDFALEESGDIPDLSPKFIPLFSLLSILVDQFSDMRRPEPGECVHLYIIAVKDSHTGRGIAPHMNRLFFQHVKSLGYRHAVTEPTGSISQHVLLNKFDFKYLAQVDYATFEFEGQRPFADIQGHDCAMLLEKDLSEMEL